MLNEDIKVEKKEKAEYPPIPKDVYPAELLDVSAVKKPTYETRNKDESEQVLETVLNLQFTILKGQDGEKDLRGRNVWANFVPPYLYVSVKNGKNKLWRIIESLLGRELTQAEEATIDSKFLNGLIGKHCRISVEPKVSGDRHFDIITDWLKKNEDAPALNAEEKDKASVKVKSETVSEEQVEKEVDSIPF